jgi:branched-chain amino acid transport system substrate-binding protein
MGPRFSSDGAAQYVLTLPGIKKIVFDQSNVPGTAYNVGGVQAIAKAKGVPVTALTENVPINNANSVALKEVQDAGPDGAVVLNFTPPEALVILQAAQKLGIEDHVKAWACSTPCNTDFLAKALGPKWVGKFFVNAELNPPDDPQPNSPQMKLYKAVFNQYGKSTVSGGIGSFSEMGFIDGEILQHALESVHGAYTKESVNKAIENVKDFDTGMNCVPWTYGPYPLHIANHADYTVGPNTSGQMEVKKGCTYISPDDPLMNNYYKAIGFKPPANLLVPNSGS